MEALPTEQNRDGLGVDCGGGMGLGELRDWLDEEQTNGLLDGVDGGWNGGGDRGWAIATSMGLDYGPKDPRNQSDGYELCEVRPPWDCCYWSLARKLGEPLWNGRPRIVPSLWGDHSTAARTVALSPSYSYDLGR